jgi:drug/metabolite transporter (DMT)-like permease
MIETFAPAFVARYGERRIEGTSKTGTRGRTMTDNLRGILAILASATGFVLNDTLVKLATEELPTGEIVVVRGIFATLILAVAASIAGAWQPVHVLMKPAIAIRTFSAALATIFIIMALRYIPLATSTAILQVTPLAVTAGAAVLLGARVGWHRWLASLTGFAGVLIIARPGSAGFVAEVWIALVALIFTVSRDLTTRFIDAAIPSLYVAVASSAIITLSGFLLLPFEAWIWPSNHALAVLGGASICLYFAYYLGIVAMRTGEIAVVAPFRYSLIVLALILGYVIWGHIPDQLSIAGIVMISGAGLYLLSRERRGIQMPQTADAGPAPSRPAPAQRSAP